MDYAAGFIVRLLCTYGRRTFSEELKKRLTETDVSNWSMMGGYYKKNVLLIEKENYYDRNKPYDFENNYSYSLYVQLQGQYVDDITPEVLYEQVGLARELVRVITDMGCTVGIVFVFTLPDNTDPIDIL